MNNSHCCYQCGAPITKTTEPEGRIYGRAIILIEDKKKAVTVSLCTHCWFTDNPNTRPVLMLWEPKTDT